jgi:hypothetical protein
MFGNEQFVLLSWLRIPPPKLGKVTRKPSVSGRQQANALTELGIVCSLSSGRFVANPDITPFSSSVRIGGDTSGTLPGQFVTAIRDRRNVTVTIIHQSCSFACGDRSVTRISSPGSRAVAVKSRGGERRVKSPGAGEYRKDERKQALRRRVVNLSRAVKTRGDRVFWDKPREELSDVFRKCGLRQRQRMRELNAAPDAPVV